MWRIRVFELSIFIFAVLIIGRLFYWQVLASEKLSAVAESQHWFITELPASRGEILTADNYPLVSNKSSYLLYGILPEITDVPKTATLIAKTLGIKEASVAARLSQDLTWVPIEHKVTREKMEELKKLDIKGLGYETEEERYYPEGSMAAQLLGFVGSDINGKDKGYFGLEGYYDGDLRGRPGKIRQEKDAAGRPILVGGYQRDESENGRSLVLTIDRSVQFIVEKKLTDAIEKYGAKSGSVIVMDPETGAILAMVNQPSYDPSLWGNFSSSLYKNPIVADSYEPGSTFKVLVMSSALNEKVVKPDTKCDECAGPIPVNDYLIRTWNNKYYPDSTMTDVIMHSDNTGMVFVGKKLGKDKLYNYLHNFGIGEPTGIDLEEETSPDLRLGKEWKDIDLATISFGQGVAVSAIQMARAVSAVANGGKLMKPYIVQKIVDKDKVIETKPKVLRNVISKDAAQLMTEMMVNAVENGEAKWTKLNGYRIAGKTGTAQIPIAGHYDDKKTIATFVGFGPAEKPRFVILVKLQEPTSSPWGSETAAPLFFSIAKEIIAYYGIAPK